jgi:hypothetical protein
LLPSWDIKRDLAAHMKPMLAREFPNWYAGPQECGPGESLGNDLTVL